MPKRSVLPSRFIKLNFLKLQNCCVKVPLLKICQTFYPLTTPKPLPYTRTNPLKPPPSPPPPKPKSVWFSCGEDCFRSGAHGSDAWAHDCGSQFLAKQTTLNFDCSSYSKKFYKTV